MLDIPIQDYQFSPVCLQARLLFNHYDVPLSAEQITERIVQIMIQATDLAQILYGGHFSRKKTWASQNFNMAAIFQDDRHGVSWNVILALK